MPELDAMSATLDRPIVANVVLQHIEDAVSLRATRSVLVRAPHVDLAALQRADDRLAAHIDGLAVAGEAGMRMALSILESPGVGQVFLLAVRALELGDAVQFNRLLTLCGAVPDARRALASALGWVSAASLRGLIAPLLASDEPALVGLGLLACVMHKVDPGPALGKAVRHAQPGIRAQGWYAAGRLGRRDLSELAHQTLMQPTSPPEAALAAFDADPVADRRAAAWALTLWGAGHSETVRSVLLTPEPGQTLPCLAAHRLAIMAAPIEWGREQIRVITAPAESNPVLKRRMMAMAGWLGDPQIMPWLLHHMADERWARLAGEAFTLITGAVLDKHGLHRFAPDDAPPSGPTDAPADADVAMDDDEDLSWPDPVKVQAWWQAHARHFIAGRRYFMGREPDAAHAIEVLKRAGQRQRIMAAEHMGLLHPAAGVFPVAAPAWRQRRWLVAMGS